MKLLTQQEVQTVKEKRLNELLEREIELHENLSKKTEELNKVINEIEFNKKKRTQEIKREIDLLKKQKEIIVKEVEELEDRRRFAEIPLENREREVIRKNQEIEKQKEKLQAEEKRLKQFEIGLLSLKDEIEENKKEVQKVSEILEERLTWLTKESNKYSSHVKELGVEREAFEDYKIKVLLQIKDEKKNVEQIREETRRDKAFITSQRDIISIERKKVASERSALASAIKEAKSKGVWVNQTTIEDT